VDTREQTPWEIRSEKISDVRVRKLDTGDYTVLGLEDKLCIERKKSVSEVATNVTEKRFERELERMEAYPHSFLILEFSIDDVMAYPVGSNIPKSKWRKIRVRGPFIMKRLEEIMVRHNVTVVFCGDVDNAQMVGIGIMKRVYEFYNGKNQID